MPSGPTLVVIEVTNTLRSPSVTGYQRFVRELLTQLQVDGSPPVQALPVTWDPTLAGLRRLTAAEAFRISTTWSASAPDETPELSPQAPRPLSARALGKARRLAARTGLAGGRRVEIPAGAVFLDLEPAWHNPASRAELLPALKARGVHVVTVVADVMPELYPQWFDQRVAGLFHNWLHAHLAHTELALAISENTKAELAQVAVRDGLTVPPTLVIPMGADFAPPAATRPVALPPQLGRYLLIVGTVEPRKNHALALDLLDRLADDYPDLGLVVVGKKGWLVGAMLERMHAHPLWEKRLVWLAGVGDDELTWLYEHAFLAIAPSYSEGLGLPVMEALRHGVPTISSTGGALPEAGGDTAQYAAPDDLNAWEDLVRAHLSEQAHHRAARARTATYHPPSWRATGTAVRTALTHLTQPELSRADRARVSA